MNIQGIIKNITRLSEVLCTIVLISLPTALDAATITSDTFSFGYGAQTNTSNTWVLKTTGSTTSGQFSFTPTVAGAWNSSKGPNYDGTTLHSTTAGSAAYTGNPASLTLSVSATWGGDPNSIAPGLTSDDVEFRLVITSIKVYATYYSAGTDTVTLPTLTLNETTSGHEKSQTLDVKKSPGHSLGLERIAQADSYGLLEWTPEDYWVSGTSFTRSFSFTPSAIPAGTGIHVDGFQVFGYIEVIPEPSSIALLGGGIGAFMVFVRKRRSLR